MPFHIVRNDITKMRVDAIVNAANPSLLGGGGVDGAIHRAAGPRLLDYCLNLGGCQVGQAKVSPGFDLPAKWILHTVGPVWCGGDRGEPELLASCYQSCLKLALELGCESLAFPLISAGAFGYPKDRALSVAVGEIGAFLLQNDMEVTLVVYDPASYQLSGRLFSEVRSYLDRYLPENRNQRTQGREMALESMARQGYGIEQHQNHPAPAASMPAPPPMPSAAKAAAPPAGGAPRPPAEEPEAQPRRGLFRRGTKASREARSPEARPERPIRREERRAAQRQETGFYGDAAFAPETSMDLEQRLRSLDESFSQMLLRKIDERGITDAACYKRANVDRKLFSKIRSDLNYRPSKPTAIAFAIALELPLPEARDLLSKAGFALSHSNKFDVIIEYFLTVGNYDIFQINETLFAFDQPLLG